MRNKIKYSLLVILLFISGKNVQMSAQQLGLKTNLLYDLTASPNLGAEVALGGRWTLDLGAGFNPFTFKDNRKWKNWLVQTEGRYWLCQPFYGHFFGVNVGGGEYNISRVSWPWPHIKSDYRYQGWSVMSGVSYGYSFLLGRHWNLELTFGVGVMHTKYKKYDCVECGNYLRKETRTFFSPTRVGINLIYMIK